MQQNFYGKKKLGFILKYLEFFVSNNLIWKFKKESPHAAEFFCKNKLKIIKNMEENSGKRHQVQQDFSVKRN